MKKTYIAPKATVVELETESLMIAQSDIMVLSEGVGEDALEGGSRSTLWGED